MIIFIRNIPKDTLRSEIIEFIRPALKGGFFNKQGRIRDIEILTLKNKDINLIEYHALVTVEPESSGIRVIKKLHGQRFKEKHTAVRQYFTRRWQNDKRMQDFHVTAGFKEKRHNATRRRNMEIVLDNFIDYSSQKTFSRRLHW
ncbi:MAG: RNA recognition motif domain-containing protein [Methylosarcina sp.]